MTNNSKMMRQAKYLKLARQITSWLKQQVKSARAKGLVLGLSGGVDSAVVGILAKKSFPKNTLALLLPCQTPTQELSDSRLIARQLRLKTKVVDLTSLYQRLKQILPPAKRTARVNLKPRLRMMVLYYFANKLNYLVVGTGNKSELMVGYFTKYGDGGVDILPLGNLLKNKVYELARTFGVSKRIITKKPSAGLWAGQTDEDELGLSYPELNNILNLLNKPSQLRHFPRRKVYTVRRLIQKSLHKRRMPAIFPL